MRFDNNFKFIYSFKSRDPTYDEFRTMVSLPDNIDTFRMYSNMINSRYGLPEEPHSKIKCYGPLVSNYSIIGKDKLCINRVYVYDTSNDMNRDYIGNCDEKEREKLLHLNYKYKKLKGEI